MCPARFSSLARSNPVDLYASGPQNPSWRSWITEKKRKERPRRRVPSLRVQTPTPSRNPEDDDFEPFPPPPASRPRRTHPRRPHGLLAGPAAPPCGCRCRCERGPASRWAARHPPGRRAGAEGAAGDAEASHRRYRGARGPPVPAGNPLPSPRRNWFPIDPSRYPADLSHDTAAVNIFSWISCLDLRTLAVLTNSTLSSSSDPHNLSFNFLIPEGSDKSPYYKLKAVLTDTNLTVASQKQIEDKLNVATPEGNLFWSFPNELAPIIIATAQFSKKRYVYISADSIIKGKVEDLARIDLGTYSIGATADCSKRIGDFISMDVLHAVQRAAAKKLVPTEPYDKDACLLDFDVLVVEPRNLQKNLIDSIMMWTKALNLANPRDRIRLAITLAFYDDHLKLLSSWKRANGNTDILTYDGPKIVCSEDGRQHQEQGSGENWRLYLNKKSDAILST